MPPLSSGSFLRFRRTFGPLIRCAGVLLFSFSAAAEDGGAAARYDEQTGLRIGPGWELVRNNCIICHSPQQIVQQRATRNTWDSIIVWMQQRGGMGELNPKDRAIILDYLEEYNGPTETARRPPIPANLMPPNPYARPVTTPERKAP